MWKGFLYKKKSFFTLKCFRVIRHLFYVLSLPQNLTQSPGKWSRWKGYLLNVLKALDWIPGNKQRCVPVSTALRRRRWGSIRRTESSLATQWVWGQSLTHTQKTNLKQRKTFRKSVAILKSWEEYLPTGYPETTEDWGGKVTPNAIQEPCLSSSMA